MYNTIFDTYIWVHVCIIKYNNMNAKSFKMLNIQSELDFFY